MVRDWDRTWADLLREVIGLAKAAKPDLAVAVNGGPNAYSGEILSTIARAKYPSAQTSPPHNSRFTSGCS